MYSVMKDEQLRSYFSWRTKFRNRQYVPACTAFLYLYCYELINQIGTAGSLDGVRQLILLWSVYSYTFYSVFESPEEYKVRKEKQSVGSVSRLYPVGAQLTLAGQAWETIRVERKSKILWVKEVQGEAKMHWLAPADTDMHTRVLQKMKEVLDSSEGYRYLGGSCPQRLQEIRQLSQAAGITKTPVFRISPGRYAIFPWLGTRQLMTLSYLLNGEGLLCTVDPNCYFPVYLETPFEGTAAELKMLLRKICAAPVDKTQLQLPEKIRLPGKFQEFLPAELLKKEYVEDYLDTTGLREWMIPENEYRFQR